MNAALSMKLEEMTRKYPVWPAIALFALVVWTFLPALGNDFISYDDPEMITSNPLAQQGLTGPGLHWALTGIVGGNWQPLASLSHLLDCQLYGVKPWGHHLTSILWHAGATVLVFLALRAMTGAAGRSWAAAAFFGLHPLRVESVAWVSERKDVMSAFFWMLTLLAYTSYVKAAPAQKRRYYFWTILVFCGGLLSKPMVVTLPCVMLLLDFWPLGRKGRDLTAENAKIAENPSMSMTAKSQSLSSLRSLRLIAPSADWKRLVIEKIPFFLLAAGSCAQTLRTLRGGMMPLTQLTLWERCVNAAFAYCRYLGELFWPHSLVIPCTPSETGSAGLVFLAFALLAGVTAGVVAAHRRGYLFTGWFWYLGTLVPVIGLIQVGGQAIAYRYTYVPTLGILVLVIWGAHDLTLRWRWQRRAEVSAMILLTVVCMALTRQQLHYWKNSGTLYAHTVEVNPDDSGANWLLAKYDESQGRLEEAAELWRKIVSLVPGNADAHDSFADVLFRLGRLQESISEYQISARLKPNDSAAEDNLGIALAQAGYLDQAAAHFNRAAKLDPKNARAEINLGLVFEKQGHIELAMEHFRQAIILEPDNRFARDSLAEAQKPFRNQPPSRSDGVEKAIK